MSLTACAINIDPIAGGKHGGSGNRRSTSRLNLYEKSLSTHRRLTGSMIMNTALIYRSRKHEEDLSKSRTSGRIRIEVPKNPFFERFLNRGNLPPRDVSLSKQCGEL
jgi:hypothetical protein